MELTIEDDSEWFQRNPWRNYRIRQDGPPVAHRQSLAVVTRGRPPFAFVAGTEFNLPDTDREIAHLLSSLEGRKMAERNGR